MRKSDPVTTIDLNSDVGESFSISGSNFLNNHATNPLGPGGGAIYLKGPTVIRIAKSALVRVLRGRGAQRR